MKDDLSQKNTWKYDIFFKCSAKMIFPKNRTGLWSFLLYYQERWYFFFPINMILFFRRKIKDDLSQKIHGNTIFFSNAPKTWSFQKNRAGIWSFLYIWKDGIFSGKYDIFSFDGKWKIIFFKKYMEIWYFLYKCYKYDIILQKK